MMRRLWIPSSVPQLLQAQHRLLQHHGLTRIYKRKRVKLRSGEICINSIESLRNEDQNKRTTCVVAHGLGSGLAFFFPNLKYLAQKFERVVAFDWLGFGASSRPEWNANMAYSNSKSTSSNEVDLATHFFIDSFHSFCDKMDLDRFTLVGHSMGGLLASEYALKHSEKLDALVLISPAGLPPHPSTSEVLSDSHIPSGLRIMKAAWDFNLTPGTFLRATGPRGPQYVRDILKHRFRGAAWNDDVLTELMADYLYHCTAQPPSAEYGMNALMVPLFDRKFGPSIYARKPVLPRIVSAKKRNILASELPIKIMFGDNDWLFSRATQHAIDKSLSGETAVQNISLHIAPDAGHHIYLDNPASLHECIDEAFKSAH